MAAVAGADERIRGFKVYVDSLTAGTTEDELAAHFKDCGSIIRSTVLRVDPTKGLVVFESEASLEPAVGLNGSTLKGSGIAVTDKRPPRGTLPRREPDERRIYVENFPEGTTGEELGAHFAACGAVTDSRVVRSGTHGFVTFESVAAVDAALAQDGSDLGGNKITVTKEAEMPKRRRRRKTGGGGGGGEGRRERAPLEPATDPANPARLWVGGIDRDVTKDQVVDFFGVDNVKDVTLRGRFALVLMVDEGAAEEAIGYSGDEIAGRKVEIAKSTLPESVAAAGGRRRRRRRTGRGGGGGGEGRGEGGEGGEGGGRRRRRRRERSDEPANPARVFVGHIPKESTAEDIEAIFGAADIEDVTMLGRYCYVLFRSEAAADAALAKNGQDMDGDALVVEKSSVPDVAIRRRRRGPREE